MSTPVQGGRSLASFRLFGFPVHVDLTFVLFVGLIGYQPGIGISELVVWVVLAFFAVLFHELGHAFAARRTGASPAIALVMLGGVTTYTPPRPLSRLTSLGISLAGPAVGLVIGAVLLVVARTVEIDEFSLTAYALRAAVFTTIGWSVLNLLPIVPLDGGQAMRELLPGDPVVRARRASIVSIVIAVALAIVALTTQIFGQFALVLLAFFVVINALQLRSARPGRTAPETGGSDPVADGGVEQEAVRLLWAGRPDEARAALGRDGARQGGDLAVDGAVLATTGHREQGFALLYQEWSRRPGDAQVTFLIALAHLLLREWSDLARLLTGPSAAAVPDVLVSRAVATARADGDEEAALGLERAARSRALG
jgi:stage IV sporulation protein FB